MLYEVITLNVLVVAVAIAAIAIVARQLVFFPLFYFTGVDQRNAEVSSVRLAQISEFGLVLSFLGVKFGHLSPGLTSSVIFAFIITALATPLLYVRAYDIHKKLEKVLAAVGFKVPPEVTHEHGGTVITSYSIHYTKLYDGYFRRRAGPVPAVAGGHTAVRLGDVA